MENLATRTTEPKMLLQRYQDLQAETPRLFPRDAAHRLGVSEGELLAARCGQGVTRLDGDWRAMAARLEGVGRVLCLTRNEWAVHERKGSYVDVRVRKASAAAIGPELDLRYDFAHWHFGFAVADERDGGTRESLQFFDKDGTAVHKIYKTDDTNAATWRELIDERRAADQSPGQAVTALDPVPAETPDAEIDAEGLRAAWRGMKNTHQFPGIMRRFGVTRPQCFRVAGAEFAERLSPDAIRRTLEGASEKGLKVMIFVPNQGATQIHTGIPGTLEETGNWFNVLDPDFNLHLRLEGVKSAWLVRKMYELGTSRSIEAYDENDEPILWIFGKRAQDRMEMPEWRDFVESLPSAEAP